jgi:ribosomal protein L20
MELAVVQQHNMLHSNTEFRYLWIIITPAVSHQILIYSKVINLNIIHEAAPLS